MPASSYCNEGQRSRPVNVDHLIHDPSRFILMAYLYVIESADHLFLMRQTSLPLRDILSHASELKKVGYVTAEKIIVCKRPHTMLRLTNEGRAAFCKYFIMIKKTLAIDFGILTIAYPTVIVLLFGSIFFTNGYSIHPIQPEYTRTEKEV